MPLPFPPGPNVGTQLAARKRAAKKARAASATDAATVLPPAKQVDGIEAWFKERQWHPFDFQREIWRRFANGESGVVHATTGTGKTYGVWFALLQQELERRNAGLKQRSGLQLLWITPMRALAADTARALSEPLAALGINWRVGIRTGDTESAERARQDRSFPEVLITTPESLSLLLTRADSRERLGQLAMVVVDEWHEMIGNKRGVQLQLALARLRRFAREREAQSAALPLEVGDGRPNFERAVPAAAAVAKRAAPSSLSIWGLSATLGNTEHALRVLLNREGGALVTGRSPKLLVVDTLLPEDPERFPWGGHLGIRMRDPVIREIESSGTTLIFTNVRSQAEVWYRTLLDARPDWAGLIALHHGSLDKAVREWVELGLKEGRLKAVVATSSLDLGVDFLPVERVLQIGSPKGVARLLQRAGRSGHAPGRTSRISLVPTNTLELVESAAARRAVEERRVESRDSPPKPLDVLVQHLVTIALGTGFRGPELFEEVRDTWAYRDLRQDEWDWALDFVGRGGESLAAYPEYHRVEADEEGMFRVPNRRIAQRHRMSIGTIVADATMLVKMGNGHSLGSIEESFINRLRKGDTFQFGGRVLELVRVQEMVASVKLAKRKSGAVPRWNGAKMSFSAEMADASLRELEAAISGHYDSPEMQLARPMIELQARWSSVPTRAKLVIESFASREGRHLFMYPFAGRAAHIGIASLLAYRIGKVAPNTFSISMNDYGFELVSPEEIDWEQAWRERREALLGEENLLEDIIASLNASELARRRFREVARVAGLVFQGYPGAPKSMKQVQASSTLFYDVFRQYDAGNRLLVQAEREVLEQELEIGRLRLALQRMRGQQLAFHPLQRPTPFAFPLMVERLREQVTTEKLGDRIARMISELEAQAAAEPGG